MAQAVKDERRSSLKFLTTQHLIIGVILFFAFEYTLILFLPRLGEEQNPSEKEITIQDFANSTRNTSNVTLRVVNGSFVEVFYGPTADTIRLDPALTPNVYFKIAGVAQFNQDLRGIENTLAQKPFVFYEDVDLPLRRINQMIVLPISFVVTVISLLILGYRLIVYTFKKVTTR